jgi:hypothetical protein
VAVSPFNYTALIWGSILDFLVWDEIPTAPIMTGAAIVTLTGLYLLRHQAFRPTPPRPAEAAIGPSQGANVGYCRQRRSAAWRPFEVAVPLGGLRLVGPGDGIEVVEQSGDASGIGLVHDGAGAAGGGDHV